MSSFATAPRDWRSHAAVPLAAVSLALVLVVAFGRASPVQTSSIVLALSMTVALATVGSL